MSFKNQPIFWDHEASTGIMKHQLGSMVTFWIQPFVSEKTYKMGKTYRKNLYSVCHIICFYTYHITFYKPALKIAEKPADHIDKLLAKRNQPSETMIEFIQPVVRDRKV